MANVRIRGQDVDVDIRAELEQFEWTKPRWTADKLIAPSPFRYDRTPSFFVTLDGEFAGCWGDSGAYDADWASGNFAKLLAFLRNETYEEAEEYLLGEYGTEFMATGAEQLTLAPLKLRMPAPKRPPLDETIMAPYTAGPCEYLRQRGITDTIQRQAGVLFSNRQQAVVLPWRTSGGKLANVKYRSTYSKVFWYQRGATPIRELVYGIERAKAVTVLCEAEIDALSWEVADYSAIAVGGVAFNRQKRDLIIRSPIEELIIATDNDKAGEKLRREVERELNGYVRVRQAYIAGEAKDANEALCKYGVEALRDAATRAVGSPGLYVNLRTLRRG